MPAITKAMKAVGATPSTCGGAPERPWKKWRRCACCPRILRTKSAVNSYGEATRKKSLYTHAFSASAYCMWTVKANDLTKVALFVEKHCVYFRTAILYRQESIRFAV